MRDPKQIWLSPECREHGDGRQWCEDDVWDTCDELGCGSKSVRYVLAADYDALAVELKRWQNGSAIRDQALIDAHALIQEHASGFIELEVTQRRVAELQGLLHDCRGELYRHSVSPQCQIDPDQHSPSLRRIDAALAGQPQQGEHNILLGQAEKSALYIDRNWSEAKKASITVGPPQRAILEANR